MVQKQNIGPHTTLPPPVDKQADDQFRADTATRTAQIPQLVEQSIQRLNRRPDTDAGQMSSPMDDINRASTAMDIPNYHLVALSAVETSGRGSIKNKSGAEGAFQYVDHTFYDAIRLYGTKIIDNLSPDAKNAINQALPYITFQADGPNKAPKLKWDQKAVELLAPYRADTYVQSLLEAAKLYTHTGAANDLQNAWLANVLGPKGADHLLAIPEKDRASTRADRILSKSAMEQNHIPPGASVEAVLERFVNYYGNVVGAAAAQLSGSPQAVAATSPPPAAAAQPNPDPLVPVKPSSPHPASRHTLAQAHIPLDDPPNPKADKLAPARSTQQRQATISGIITANNLDR